MSLVKEITKIAASLKASNEKNGTSYLTNYGEDVTRYDADFLENFYYGGDMLVWEVRGCGAGTNLFNAHNKSEQERFSKTAQENSKFYALSLVAANEGTIQELTKEEAGKFLKENHNPRKYRRRETIYDQIASAMGLESTKDLSRDLKSDLMQTPKEDIYLSLKLDNVRRAVVCEMVKPELKKDEPGISRTKVYGGTYYMPATLESTDKLYQPLHIKITPGRDPVYGLSEVVSPRQFNAAQRKAQKNQQSLEMGV